MSIIFTRYLYLKSGVIKSLKHAINKRDLDQTYFWLFELFYSGFSKDIHEVLENITKTKPTKNIGVEYNGYIFATLFKRLVTKNINTRVLPQEIDKYITLVKNVPNYKYLSVVCRYPIIKTKYILKRKNELLNSYRRDWLKYVCNTPIWKERILEHGGKISKDDIVTFFKEDDFENFSEKFDYEPDEQPQEIQTRCLGL